MTLTPPTSVAGLAKLASGKGNLGIRVFEVPAPSRGQAVIRVLAAGVCGTDLHIADDEFRYEAPVTMGHEVTGVVESVGSTADSNWVGKRVAVETYFSTCGSCRYCRSGRPNLCADRRSIGSRENGGFAPLLLIPTSCLWELPDSVGEHAGALAEPLACVTRCLLDPPVIEPGNDVLVIGPGAMGLLTAQVARAAGGQVTVAGLERDGHRLAVARELGLQTLVLDGGPTSLAPDVVCECSGSEKGAELGLDVVRKGGRYVQVGIFGRPVTLPLDLVLYKELQVSSGNASTPSSWSQAIGLLEAGLVELDPLVSSVASLGEWESVLASVRRGEGLKHVIDPREAGEA